MGKAGLDDDESIGSFMHAEFPLWLMVLLASNDFAIFLAIITNHLFI